MNHTDINPVFPNNMTSPSFVVNSVFPNNITSPNFVVNGNFSNDWNDPMIVSNDRGSNKILTITLFCYLLIAFLAQILSFRIIDERTNATSNSSLQGTLEKLSRFDITEIIIIIIVLITICIIFLGCCFFIILPNLNGVKEKINKRSK